MNAGINSFSSRGNTSSSASNISAATFRTAPATLQKLGLQSRSARPHFNSLMSGIKSYSVHHFQTSGLTRGITPRRRVLNDYAGRLTVQDGVGMVELLNSQGALV